MMCGVPHYELLWSQLDSRQMAEVELFRGLMPIGSEICPVSRPGKKPLPAEERNRMLAQMFG